jgi:hypothetical protein
VIVAGTPIALHVDARRIIDKHLRAVHGNVHLHHIGVLTGVKPKVRRIKDGKITM